MNATLVITARQAAWKNGYRGPLTRDELAAQATRIAQGR